LLFVRSPFVTYGPLLVECSGSCGLGRFAEMKLACHGGIFVRSEAALEDHVKGEDLGLSTNMKMGPGFGKWEASPHVLNCISDDGKAEKAREGCQSLGSYF
jgi:hypothetical protein